MNSCRGICTTGPKRGKRCGRKFFLNGDMLCRDHNYQTIWASHSKKKLKGINERSTIKKYDEKNLKLNGFVVPVQSQTEPTQVFGEKDPVKDVETEKVIIQESLLKLLEINVDMMKEILESIKTDK